MKTFLILSLMFFIVACSSSQESASNSGELNGGWLPIKQEMGGQEMPVESFEGERLAIVGKSFLFVAESADEGTVTYDDGKMDIYVEVGVNAGRHFMAIYKLEQNILTICYDLKGGDYPTSFDTSINPNLFLSVFRKE